MSALDISPPRGAREREAAADFLGSVLRPGGSASLRAEHPAVFGDAPIGELRVCWEGARPVGGAAFAVRRFTTPLGPVKLGLIGSVATDPGLRGRGIATALLTACERALTERGCALAVLWADAPAFYERLGYAEAGTEWLAVLERPLDGAAPGSPCPYTRQDLDTLERLRLAEPSHSDRTGNESKAAFEGPKTRVTVYRGIDGTAAAYLAVGRGQDLPEVAHEAAGSLEGIVALWNHALAARASGPLVALVNPWRDDLLTFLRARGVALRAGILGMVKVLNAGALHAALASAYPARALSTLTSFTGADLARAVLGHRGSRGPLTELESRLGLAPVPDFPLTPFVSGYESI